MTVEQNYRIERFDPEDEPVQFFGGEALFINWKDGYAVVKDTRLQAVKDALEVIDCRACFVHRGIGDADSDICDNRMESRDEACFMYDMIRTELIEDALTKEDNDE